MQVRHGLSRIKGFRRPVAVALGVFDGVHAGHRVILRSTVAQARRISGISVVITFWPHPCRQASLYSLEHRLRLIETTGIDVCIVVPFTRRFSRISASDFIEKILCSRIGARYVYVGRNFRFGRKAEGSVGLLRRYAQRCCFAVKAFDVVKVGRKPVSSTLIRSLIRAGDLASAKKLLTRPVAILGTVIKGISAGRRLGFPTANIDPHHEIIPPCGVYMVYVIIEEKKYRGVCYIGKPAAFLRKERKISETRCSPDIEVHIFNFKKNIYGKDLEIQFVRKIRESKEFNSAFSLITQIKADILNARRLFFWMNRRTIPSK